MSARAGMTLVELLVVLVLVGLLLSLSTMAMPGKATPVMDWDSEVAAAQLEAARVGRAIGLRNDTGNALLVLPDGEVLGAGFDPLTGGRHAAR